jgi:hypothetical protein
MNGILTAKEDQVDLGGEESCPGSVVMTGVEFEGEFAIVTVTLEDEHRQREQPTRPGVHLLLERYAGSSTTTSSRA